MSPVRWRRRLSSETQLYNIPHQLVLLEPKRAPLPLTYREKRNPLLERVKNTKLSYFRSNVNMAGADTAADDCQR